jgi:hypothetical protein
MQAPMRELVRIAIFVGLGLASGFVFFGVLDRLNARIAQRAEEGAPGTTRAIAATLILRFILLGAIIFVSLRTGIGYLFVTFAAFMLTRALFLRCPSRPTDTPNEE